MRVCVFDSGAIGGSISTRIDPQQIAGCVACPAAEIIGDGAVPHVEAGGSLEADALLGSVLEIAELTDTAAPTLSIVHTLTAALNHRIHMDGRSTNEPVMTTAPALP